MNRNVVQEKKLIKVHLKASYSMIFNEDIDEYVMNQRI